MRRPNQSWLLGWLDPERAGMDLSRCHKDAIDETVHLFCALFLCFFTPWMTTATELAGLPLLVWLVLGFWRHMTAARWAVVLPQFILLAAFACWQWISLLWTADVHEGIKQAGATRWLWLLPVLYSIQPYRRALLVALMLGFLAGNLSQLMHAIGTQLGVVWLTWSRMPHRDSGWWDPVVGGSLLTAALGLYLPSVFVGATPRARLLGIGGTLMTLLAIFATGTRGAWIAATGLVVVAAVVCLWPRRDAAPAAERRGSARIPLMIAALAVVIAVAALGPTLRARLTLAERDLQRVVQGDDFNSDTGTRLLLNWWAAQAFAEKPLQGVGVGGFRSWCRQHMISQGVDPATRSTHAHAHNALLQVAATTGVVGLALAAGIITIGLRNAWGAGMVGPGAGAFPSTLAPFFALLGLLLVSAFDSVHINAQTSALGFLLLSLSPGWWPTSFQTVRLVGSPKGVLAASVEAE